MSITVLRLYTLGATLCIYCYCKLANVYLVLIALVIYSDMLNAFKEKRRLRKKKTLMSYKQYLFGYLISVVAYF